MPRVPRLDAPLALHHVMSRGIERRVIFEDDHDRHDLLARLETMVAADAFTIYAWTLMPNHFHLLVRTRDLSLSRTMQTILGGYASAFNIRHRRAGHLFQNRFKSILVQEVRVRGVGPRYKLGRNGVDVRLRPEVSPSLAWDAPRGLLSRI